jgi:hypothetical protein
MIDGKLKQFRGLIRYGADSYSYIKCGISQVYYRTGEDVIVVCTIGVGLSLRHAILAHGS